MQQPIGGQQQQIHPQQVRSVQQQVYAPQQLQQSHSPVQQQVHQAAKYQLPMSQGSPQTVYGMGSQQQQMMAAYNQNGTDYQQPQSQHQKDTYAQQYAQYPIGSELQNLVESSANRMAIVEVQIGMEQLASEPHEFELWANAIKSRISSGISTDDAPVVAWLLVEIGYQGSNAQYSFARLSNMLDADIKNFTTQFVVPRVAYFIGNGVEALSPDHLSNFIVFLAELYDKTEVNGVRISRLGHYIIEQSSILLNNEAINDRTVKNCVQSLKLVGRHIEEDQDPACLNNLFEQMNKLQTSPNLSSAVKNNIRQLNQLREREWGINRSENYTNGSSNGPFFQNGSGNEGIMYGPDGQPISEEERLFLEESCRSLETSFPEMEYDINDDYENFMHEQQTEETAMNVAKKALERLSVD